MGYLSHLMNSKWLGYKQEQDMVSGDQGSRVLLLLLRRVVSTVKSGKVLGGCVTIVT